MQPLWLDVFRNVCRELGRLDREGQDRVLGAILAMIEWADARK